MWCPRKPQRFAGRAELLLASDDADECGADQLLRLVREAGLKSLELRHACQALHNLVFPRGEEKSAGQVQTDASPLLKRALAHS